MENLIFNEDVYRIAKKTVANCPDFANPLAIQKIFGYKYINQLMIEYDTNLSKEQKTILKTFSGDFLNDSILMNHFYSYLNRIIQELDFVFYDYLEMRRIRFYSKDLNIQKLKKAMNINNFSYVTPIIVSRNQIFLKQNMGAFLKLIG
jgi:hypothetical protein